MQEDRDLNNPGRLLFDGITMFNFRPARREDIEPLLNDAVKIGNGAFGTVYKVRYKGQIVALKHFNVKSPEGKMYFSIR